MGSPLHMHAYNAPDLTTHLYDKGRGESEYRVPTWKGQETSSPRADSLLGVADTEQSRINALYS
jgi:hypothetical protein